MTASDILDQIETDIVNRLSGDPWFAQPRQLSNGNYVSIPVIAEQLGDPEVLATQAVAKAGPGICVVVQCLEWSLEWKNVPGPYIAIEKMDINLWGIETVMFNRGSKNNPSPTGTLKTIKATMVWAAALLQGWTPPSLTRALVVGGATLIARNQGMLQYNMSVVAAGGVFSALTQKVATPVVSIGAGMVTLTCATPGACLCYTLNNIFPSTLTGNIYTAPFAVQSGAVLKVNATLDRWIQSDTTIQTL